MTVEGRVAPELLGCTLIHEHVHADFTPILRAHGYESVDERPLDVASAAEARWNPGAFPDNYRLTDVELVIEELAPFLAAGGRTVVDTTPVGVARDPEALRAIASASGVRVVMGCGYYLEPAHPPDVAARSAEDLASGLVAEIRDGVAETGIRPGIIGEIGTSGSVTAAEEKVLRGAAWAHRETGLALTVHLHPWAKEGLAVLELLNAEGVDPAKTVLNHLTTAVDDDAYLDALLARGVHLAFDLFGFDHSLLGSGRWPPSDFDVVRAVAGLVRDGYAEQVLVSQDVGVRTRLRRWGGWGYAHLLEHVLPLLREAGVGDADLDRVLVANPARILAVAE